jgi:hypothetical protein
MVDNALIFMTQKEREGKRTRKSSIRVRRHSLSPNRIFLPFLYDMPSQGVKPFRKFGGEAKRRALFKYVVSTPCPGSIDKKEQNEEERGLVRTRSN